MDQNVGDPTDSPNRMRASGKTTSKFQIEDKHRMPQHTKFLCPRHSRDREKVCVNPVMVQWSRRIYPPKNIIMIFMISYEKLSAALCSLCLYTLRINCRNSICAYCKIADMWALINDKVKMYMQVRTRINEHHYEQNIKVSVAVRLNKDEHWVHLKGQWPWGWPY